MQGQGPVHAADVDRPPGGPGLPALRRRLGEEVRDEAVRDEEEAVSEPTATEIAIRAIRREERQKCAQELRTVINATSYNRGDTDWSVDGHDLDALATSWERRQ